VLYVAKRKGKEGRGEVGWGLKNVIKLAERKNKTIPFYTKVESSEAISLLGCFIIPHKLAATHKTQE